MGVEGLRRLRVRDSSDQEEVNWTQNSQLKNTNKKSHSQPLIPSNPTTGDDDLNIWDVTENFPKRGCDWKLHEIELAASFIM